ncbi:MAG: phosphoenolpyruvate--protein phosphotransferase [Chloroflexi bacterium]|nr:phosphoenolpyruvate--protein phosphotransferase [Chloroflexota bacterium]
MRRAVCRGALAAAVQASIDSPIDVLLAEARGALAAKQGHLSASETPSALSNAADTQADNTGQLRLQVTVPNRLGLHLRPAARLVGILRGFHADVAVRKGDRTVSAASLNGVALLDARQGDRLEFTATGPDARAALDAIAALATESFGDVEARPVGVPASASAAVSAVDLPANALPGNALPTNTLAGIAAVGGTAVGQVRLLSQTHPTLPERSGDAQGEIARFRGAVAAAQGELDGLIGRVGIEEAGIFEAQRLMLADEDVLRAVLDGIAHGRSAEAAWWDSVEAMAKRYRSATSALLQGRAADVLDLGRRVLQRLMPDLLSGAAFPEDTILVASDLTPSEVAQLDPGQVVGILLQFGGAATHAAILARARGIPMVAGLGTHIADLREGLTVVLDGSRGRVTLQPPLEQIAAVQREMDARQVRLRDLRESTHLPAVTPDGRRIEVMANIGQPSDSAAAVALGAEGVGVFRTELLWMNRDAPPSEEEQVRAYAAAAAGLNGHPLTIRTLDAGGDKPIGYLDMAREENPFLGHRGIRFWFDRIDLARVQLRAICRVSRQHPVRVLFPMIATVDEIRAARRLLKLVQRELAAGLIASDPAMPIGIMIEVPSAVTMAEALAAEADFFSIGTNDLTQYLMAADRGNAAVSALATPFQPALLRAIGAVVDAAHAHGRPVAVCGEMAGDPRLTRLLLGLGVDELSMSAPAIPEVKAIVRATNYADARALAGEVLSLRTAAEVEAALTGDQREASIGN